MAVNIQKIIDELNTKAAAADSSMGTDYLFSLSKAVLRANSYTGVIEYVAKSQLPAVDSGVLGNFAYVGPGKDVDSVYGDSFGAFYYAVRIGSADSGWDRIRTTADSDAEAAGGGGGFSVQGSTYGYQGGNNSNLRIEQYAYASDGNSTNLGDMNGNTHTNLDRGTGIKSSTAGYVAGGNSPLLHRGVSKYVFASGTTSYVADILLSGAHGMIGAGANSSTHGYTAGGHAGSPTTQHNVIQKFATATDGNATDVGDLTLARYYLQQGQSSTTHGYAANGYTPYRNTIDKWSFTTDGNATDVGDTTDARFSATAQSSADNGYSSGGFTPGRTNVIDKFPFSTDANATDVGDLSSPRYGPSASNSTTHGYTAAGNNPAGNSNIIDKFPFSTDANATDVGDLSATGMYSSGFSE